MPGWGELVGKISQQFQGRIERLKNEKASLEKELGQIENLRGDSYTDKMAKRESEITKRIKVLNVLLGNNAKD